MVKDQKLKQAILNFFTEMCYFFETEKTIRSGHVLVGRYGRADIALPSLDNPIETVAMHSGSLAWMMFLFEVYFGNLQPDKAQLGELAYSMLFALIHDMAEAQSEEGDQPDDRERPEKVGFEENLLSKCLSNLPPEWQRVLLETHDDAEGFNSPLGRRRKGIDKLHAVIRSFKFDLDGHRGDMEFKNIGYKLGYFEEELSRRDIYFSEIIKSTSPTESWSAHLLWVAQGFDEYSLYHDILSVISEKVNGKSFWWLEDDDAIKQILAYS